MARPQTITDQQIDEAARRVFLRRGPSAPVGLVAQELGVSSAALFQRGGSKQALLARALRPEMSAVLARIGSGPAAGTPAIRQLGAILDDLCGVLRLLVPSLVTMRAAGLPVSPAGPPPPLLVRQKLARWLSRAYADASMAGPPPATLAEILLAAIESRCFHRHVGGDAFAPGSDRRFIRRLLADLVTTTPRRRRTK